MEVYYQIGLQAFIPAILTFVFLFLEKQTNVKEKLPYGVRQTIYGIAFGIVGIYCTERGIEYNGAVVNARDAAVVTAGLMFGAPAGIIAGIIAGLERWFAVAWGVGTYTRVACTVSTIIAGFYSGLLRKHLFDDEKPSWGLSFAIGLVMEVFHMVMVFLTNMNDTTRAAEVVKLCSVIMVPANALGVMISAMCDTLATTGRLFKKKVLPTIAEILQKWLLVAVVLIFFVTSAFVYKLQTSIAEKQAENFLTLAIKDVVSDVEIKLNTNKTQIEIATEISTIALNRHVGKTGYVIIADNNRWIVSQPENVDVDRLDDFKFNKNNVNSFFKAEINGEDSLCYCQKAEGYYVVSIMPTAEAYDLRDTAVYANTFVEILAFAALFGLIYQLIKSVIVSKVSKINKSLGKITDGDLNEVIDVRNNVEFDSLSNDINSTVDTLKNYIAEASARIDAELEYAKNIQNSALPHYFPNNEHFEIYALMDAAKEVGGDFYDFSRLDKDTFNFLVADVSGKGIPGAMFMMRAKSVLSAFTEMREEVNDIFTKGNERLCEGNDAGMFVTSWEASLDIPTGHIKYANAGHNYPVVRRIDGTVEFVKGKPGFVLAGMEGIQYKIQELDLKPGDILFLYTDGVVEATNINNELFGDDRLLNVMKQVEFETMEQLCNKILGEVNRFVGEAEQFDDITMLAIKYLG